MVKAYHEKKGPDVGNVKSVGVGHITLLSLVKNTPDFLDSDVLDTQIKLKNLICLGQPGWQTSTHSFPSTKGRIKEFDLSLFIYFLMCQAERN